MKKAPTHVRDKARRTTIAARRRGVATSRFSRANSVRLRKDAASRLKDDVTLVAPETFAYDTSRDKRREVEKFARTLASTLSAGRTVFIDFSRTTKLHPCGVLLFLALLERLCKEYPGRIKGSYPENDVVEQMFQSVGVVQMLGLEPRCTVSHEDVRKWRYFAGSLTDRTLMESSAMEAFMVELRTELGEAKQMGLGDCISEALTNVKHHAYTATHSGGWWVFATIGNESVTVAIYDRGGTIPGTLLAKPEFLDYLTLKFWQIGRGDARLIQAAAGGRTRTRLPFRGKGLPEMLQYSRDIAKSRLAIFSRRGFFRYNGGAETVGRLSRPIVGTMILWTVPLR